MQVYPIKKEPKATFTVPNEWGKVIKPIHCSDFRAGGGKVAVPRVLVGDIFLLELFNEDVVQEGKEIVIRDERVAEDPYLRENLVSSIINCKIDIY